MPFILGFRSIRGVLCLTNGPLPFAVVAFLGNDLRPGKHWTALSEADQSAVYKEFAAFGKEFASGSKRARLANSGVRRLLH
jgi:hypothetical protein